MTFLLRGRIVSRENSVLIIFCFGVNRLLSIFQLLEIFASKKSYFQGENCPNVCNIRVKLRTPDADFCKKSSKYHSEQFHLKYLTIHSIHKAWQSRKQGFVWLFRILLQAAGSRVLLVLHSRSLCRHASLKPLRNIYSVRNRSRVTLSAFRYKATANI